MTSHGDGPRADVNGRRGFLLAASGAATAPLLLGPLARAARAQLSIPPMAVPAANDGQSVVVKTTHGQVRGVRNGGLAIFKGVPYAGSPAGAGRFKAPPSSRPGPACATRSCTGRRRSSRPTRAGRRSGRRRPSSEECLVPQRLDAGPADGKKRPVMFYSHGGGFATGNGGAEVWPQNLSHDGASLAEGLRRRRRHAQPPAGPARVPLPRRPARRGVRGLGRGRHARHRRGARVGARRTSRRSAAIPAT